MTYISQNCKQSPPFYLRFEHNSSSSYKHFTIQTYIVTKYGARVYTRGKEGKGKIDNNITVGG